MNDVLLMAIGAAIFFVVALAIAFKQERDSKRKHH